MNKPLTADEINADPTILRSPDARAKQRNRSGQAGGAAKSYLDFPFAWRSIEMLESPAYRALSLSARKVLDRLEIEFERHGRKPMENGNLPCTHNDFVEYGIHTNGVGPAIRETVALGFIRVTRPGSAGNADQRQAAHYLLTYRHSGSNVVIEDGWKRIQSLAEAEQVSKAARLRKSHTKASKFGRQGAAARWDKNRFPVTKSIAIPVTKSIAKTPKFVPEIVQFPVTKSIALSRISQGRGYGDEQLAALPWRPPAYLRRVSRLTCEAGSASASALVH